MTGHPSFNFRGKIKPECRVCGKEMKFQETLIDIFEEVDIHSCPNCSYKVEDKWRF